MNRKITLGLLIATVVLTTGCASIFSKSIYPVSINSTPSEAKITIENSSKLRVYEGVTPATVRLNSSEGFFKKATYSIKFEKEGHATKTISIQSKLDGWYFGNLLIGGFLGMLIIDPATGAMFALETSNVGVSLDALSTTASKGELKIYDLDQIPEEWVDHLVKL